MVTLRMNNKHNIEIPVKSIESGEFDFDRIMRHNQSKLQPQRAMNTDRIDHHTHQQQSLHHQQPLQEQSLQPDSFSIKSSIQSMNRTRLHSTSTLSTSSKIHSLEFEVLSIKKQLDQICLKLESDSLKNDAFMQKVVDCQTSLLYTLKDIKTTGINMNDLKQFLEHRLSGIEVVMKGVKTMDSTQSKEEKRLKDKVGSIQKRGGVVDISHLLLPSDDAYVDHFHNQLVPIGEIDINCGVNGHEEDDSDMFDVCLYPVTDCKKSVSVKRERTNLHNAGKVKPADIRSHLKTLLGIEYPKKKRGRPKRV